MINVAVKCIFSMYFIPLEDMKFSRPVSLILLHSFKFNYCKLLYEPGLAIDFMNLSPTLVPFKFKFCNFGNKTDRLNF